MNRDEITCVNKVYSDGKSDVFEYRDMYNDVKTITVPTKWGFDEDEAEKFILEQKIYNDSRRKN